MVKYKIKEEDEDLVEEFINRSLNDHMRFTRDESTLKNNIRIGKLGEIAYKAYAGDNISEIDWKPIPQPGPDFRSIEGTGIQVKTIAEDARWCSFYNWNFDTLVVLRMKGDLIELIGEFDLEFLKGIAKKSNFKGWYIDPVKCV